MRDAGNDAGGRDGVLIYPYWNVNEAAAQTGARSEAVLIYPYWNVNEEYTYSAM